MQQDTPNVEDEGRGGGWMSYLLRFALEESDDEDEDAQGGVQNKSECDVSLHVCIHVCMCAWIDGNRTC